LLRSLTLHTGASLAAVEKDEVNEDKERPGGSFVVPGNTTANQLFYPISHQPISL
jgi:hypothetical protein